MAKAKPKPKAKVKAKARAKAKPKAEAKEKPLSVTAPKVRITQIRSTIKRPETQLRTIQSLGLGKPKRSVDVVYTPQIQGMVRKVSHLVSVLEL